MISRRGCSGGGGERKKNLSLTARLAIQDELKRHSKQDWASCDKQNYGGRNDRTVAEVRSRKIRFFMGEDVPNLSACGFLELRDGRGGGKVFSRRWPLVYAMISSKMRGGEEGFGPSACTPGETVSLA